MHTIVLCVFVLVYAGMILGRLPGLALDRTGAAVVGAIILIAGGVLSVGDAFRAADATTLALLFGLMVISAQLRLGGFYSAVTRRLTATAASPAGLLARVMGAAAVLSAVLANDIICLAMTPIVVEATLARGLSPLPYLLGLAMAANLGSAATLIGNPQNMLIGQVTHLSFTGYLLAAWPCVLVGLLAAWGTIVLAFRGRFGGPTVRLTVESPPYDGWQSTKGLAALGLCVLLFLWGRFPRETVALACAGVLLLSRRMPTHKTLSLIDWPLLLLFMGLFVVNAAVESAGFLAACNHWLATVGVDLSRPAWLFGVTAVLSNVVSNVPAVMLLLPGHATPEQGTLLAVSSTLAGNVLLPGSIANLIVAEQAQIFGVRLSPLTHAKVGVPATVAALAFSGWWLIR